MNIHNLQKNSGRYAILLRSIGEFNNFIFLKSPYFLRLASKKQDATP